MKVAKRRFSFTFRQFIFINLKLWPVNAIYNFIYNHSFDIELFISWLVLYSAEGVTKYRNVWSVYSLYVTYILWISIHVQKAYFTIRRIYIDSNKTVYIFKCSM